LIEAKALSGPLFNADLVIFDLDGTLIDSKLDLVLSVNATRSFMGMAELAEETISSYVGNGAPVLIQRALGEGAPQADIDRALEFFLGYYKLHKLDNTRLYPGAQEALDQLRGDGVQLAILTNKPVGASRGIVAGLGLDGYFLRVYGGNSFAAKKPDPIGIETLLADSGAGRERTLMVGDSHVDIETARNARVAACGVRYGFQPDSFHRAAPNAIFDDLRELAQVIVSRRRLL
jgi:phosphoglycolate phosphatase